MGTKKSRTFQYSDRKKTKKQQKNNKKTTKKKQQKNNKPWPGIEPEALALVFLRKFPKKNKINKKVT